MLFNKKSSTILFTLLSAIILIMAFTACDKLIPMDSLLDAIPMETEHQHSWADATCTVPKTCSTCNETEGTALGHSWIEATFHTPQSCSVCQETQGSPIDVGVWLKNYIITNGVETKNGYDLYIDTTTSESSYRSIYINYDFTYPDIIMLGCYGNTGSFSTMICFDLDLKLSGSYDWILLDSDDSYMKGTITASEFSGKSKTIPYSNTNLSLNSTKQSAKELGASTLQIILLNFNEYFDEYGLSAKDLGFKNFN